MWTSKNRARYDRSKLRYPSDLTDDEWKLVEPLIPPRPAAPSPSRVCHCEGAWPAASNNQFHQSAKSVELDIS